MDLKSKYFSWEELLWLPTWGRCAEEKDGLNDDVRTQLVLLADKMDQVRDYFNAPINVHVAFRPPEYNKFIGGAPDSAHMYGMACDFDVKGLDCDSARDKIINAGLLASLSMRMEKRPGSNWIHLDFRAVPEGGNRYFLP
jgi:uncharacterized protein YcbK (DUF882 family)